MGVDPIRAILRNLKMTNQLDQPIRRDRARAVPCVDTARPKAEATDRRTRCDGFLRLRVIQRHPTVLDQPRHHLNVIHLSAIGEAARKLENVEGLTTGVRVSAKFQIMRSKQAMEMQMQQLQSQNSSNTPRIRSWRSD